ncbi:hypothetical protein LEP1GSC058_1008 [Leptospira fainei serovar Hurstbridge str. BUT 6]|uniref:Uncharacterized protein n=1 Tax=Leptospira fainei serovar Hurstbridge str. BUT 6 TaxID=1193011 RepID=S3UW15_9LEPT|nr:hypothetical protein LEP1GSC058_1008 [Leptospira fainei serovar Hurstbridge str. BUT 6]
MQKKTLRIFFSHRLISQTVSILLKLQLIGFLENKTGILK